MIIFTRKRRYDTLSFSMNGDPIPTVPVVTYLGLVLDSNLHLNYVSPFAAK